MNIRVINLAYDTDADVDYLFLQVDPTRQTVSSAQNCGNLLAGVGVFAALLAPAVAPGGQDDDEESADGD